VLPAYGVLRYRKVDAGMQVGQPNSPIPGTKVKSLASFSWRRRGRGFDPIRRVEWNNPSPLPASQGRVQGFDLARGIAIIGMVLVNYSIDTNEEDAPDWLISLIGAIQGRAAAIFVVLAGVGISLLSQRARIENRPELFHSVRIILLKRAGFLLVLGISLIPLWPADILHFYAVYLTVSIFFLKVSSRTLWVSATILTGTFVILFFLLDYNAGWNTDGEYVYVWATTFRRLLFDGYYPLFPWMGFVLTKADP